MKTPRTTTQRASETALSACRRRRLLRGGEQLLKKDYARAAREQAPVQLNVLGEHLKARVEAAALTQGLLRHTYDAANHRVYAGKSAVTADSFSGLDFYRLDVAVGHHPDAAQFMDLSLAPQVNPVVWHFVAAADDSGFF